MRTTIKHTRKHNIIKHELKNCNPATGQHPCSFLNLFRSSAWVNKSSRQSLYFLLGVIENCWNCRCHALSDPTNNPHQEISTKIVLQKKKSQFITLLLVELLSPFCSPAVSCCQPWQPSSRLHYFQGINWSDNNTGRRCILGDLGTVKICDYQMPDCWKHCLIRWSPNNSVGFNCCI